MKQYENDFDKIEEEYRNKFNRTFPFFMYQCSEEEATEIMKKCIKRKINLLKLKIKTLRFYINVKLMR